MLSLDGAVSFEGFLARQEVHDAAPHTSAQQGHRQVRLKRRVSLPVYPSTYLPIYLSLLSLSPYSIPLSS